MRALLCFCLVVGLSGCMTFQKALRRYATTKVDTTYTTVTATIPRDSVALRIVTDTTTVIREVRQGRARIIYQRDRDITMVKADCDSVVIEKRVPYQVTKQIWGIDPKYKRRMLYWQIAFFALLALFILAGLTFWFTRLFTVSVSRKPKRQKFDE